MRIGGERMVANVWSSWLIIPYGTAFRTLEARGFHVHLVKARQRKSDVEDCRKRSRGQHKKDLPAHGYVA